MADYVDTLGRSLAVYPGLSAILGHAGSLRVTKVRGEILGRIAEHTINRIDEVLPWHYHQRQQA